MTREEAKRRMEICRDFLANNYSDMGEPNFTAFNMAIKALSQEPCTVIVSEKEPNEITEEVTLRFFKNSLKIRWHDFVIYNVEWLKKNWQMEMDIVCGVKPCDDAISREAVLKKIDYEVEHYCKYLEEVDDKRNAQTHVALVSDNIREEVEQLPSVTQKSGKWINDKDDMPTCSKCGYIPPYSTVIDDYEYSNYCPNCGAKMESEDKE